MTIQRIIDSDGIPPYQGGKRVPLGIAIKPTHAVRPQPSRIRRKRAPSLPRAKAALRTS